jgi:hypothetical protein
MRTFLAGGDPSAACRAQIDQYTLADEPLIARLHEAAGWLMGYAALLFWAAIVVLSVQASLAAKNAAIDPDQFQPAVNGVAGRLPDHLSMPVPRDRAF